MNNSFADRVIAFNRQLAYAGELPQGFKVLNPYLELPETMQVMQQFYKKYYADSGPRKFIIGINPSRHGAGITGVPFTDTKRLEQVCGITMQSAYSHEPSSVFLYEVIAAFGGPEVFYKQFYINSPFPLAIVRYNSKKQWVNANYYDDKALFESVKDFMVQSLKQHIKMGLDTDEVYVLGKKNATFLEQINKKEHLFGRMQVLEHPRFIQQYKSKEKQYYIDKYILKLTASAQSNLDLDGY